MNKEAIDDLYSLLNDSIYIRDSSLVDFLFRKISRLCINDVDSTEESIGAIVQIGAGNGKTELLNTIKYCVERVADAIINVYSIDASNVQFLFSEASVVIEVQKSISKVKNTLLLIDNIDMISRATDMSILCNLIDKYSCQTHNTIVPRVSFICTCSTNSKLLKHLYQPCRLGNLIKIGNISDDTRRSLFNFLLKSNCCKVNFDNEYNKFSSDATHSIDNVIDALVKITVGFNVGDIFQLFRESGQFNVELKFSIHRLMEVAFGYRSRVQFREYDTKINSISNSISITPVGIDLILDRIRMEVIKPLSNSENFHHFNRMNISLCSGIVIHGPIGCGKTTLANWILSETKHLFTSMSISCADLIDKIVGKSEKKISQIFEHARKMSPCFLVLDNIDTIFGAEDYSHKENEFSCEYKSKRTSHKALDRVLSTLLVEIDGVSTMKDNLVIVIATTTDMTSLDSSLLRPGRLELHLEVPLPDYSQRKAIIAAAIAKRFESFANSFDSIIENLADITNGKSVADIVSYIDETLYGVIRHFVYDCIEVNEQNLERILYQKLLSY